MTTQIEQAYLNLTHAVAALNASCQQLAIIAQQGHEQNIRKLSENAPNLNLMLSDWTDKGWDAYSPNPNAILPGVVRVGTSSVQLLPSKNLPALLPIFDQRHLFITGHETRARAVLQAIALRLTLTAAPGTIRLVLTDPQGGGSHVASLLRLPNSIRGASVASSPEEIEKAIQGIVVHIKTVIQERLLDTYADAHAYNAAQPAIAIPYYGLVLPDCPAGLSERAWDNLKFVAQSGARAGVMLLASLSNAVSPPRKANIAEIMTHAQVIQVDEQRLRWQAENAEPQAMCEAIYEPLPAADVITQWCERLKQTDLQSNNHVAFSKILPPTAQWWQGNATHGLKLPIGIDSRGQLCQLLINSPNVNMLIGGAPGYGKSRLLDVIITQLATTYSPDEVALYLVDLREGVGFQDYVRLPHARVVALENEREFGLGILRHLQAEIPARSALFKAVNQSIDNYPDFRHASHQPLPRILLIIDEFQVLFSEEDAISREAIKILEDLSRRGRGYGIHLILCSQSPRAYAANIDPILNQVGLRFAFRCTERVSHSILGDGNGEASGLEQPGEGILNTGMGSRDANLRLRVALLEPAARAQLLEQVRAKASKGYAMPQIFEGNTPAKLSKNDALRAAWQQPSPDSPTRKPKLWLGEALELSGQGDHAQLELMRLAGNNGLVMGDHERHAYAVLLACALSLKAQFAANHLRLIIADFALPESEVEGVWAKCLPLFAPSADLLPGRKLAALLPELKQKIEARLDGNAPHNPSIVIVVCGLHRWRDLRPSGEYGSQSNVSKDLMWILDNGPEVGVHVLAWVDAMPNFERMLKRSALQTFDLRVGLRMAEADSAALFGNAVAAKLADMRAVLRHESWQANDSKKFKPYDLNEFVQWVA